MGIRDGFPGFLRRKEIIALDEAPAAGEARAGLHALMAALAETQLREVRAASSSEYLEAVIDRTRLEEHAEVLAGTLGKPCKPFGARVKFVRALAENIDAFGGVGRTQCLYLRRFEDDYIVYAALWPWDDPESITLKVGVFERSRPAAS
jgi:hypothetical protein